MSTPPIYTTGGTVQAGGGIYLSRQADADLLTLCQEREFSYILTSRQMGKSSLMVQTMVLHAPNTSLTMEECPILSTL